MPDSNDLKTAFDTVADWMEAHLEKRRGRECGMSCGGFIRAYRDVAVGDESKLDEQSERMLLQFVRFYLEQTRTIKPVEPSSSTFPPPYDSGQ